MVVVITSMNPSREGFLWFLQLKRPRWLTFERWIPLIWIGIYICFYISALLSWNAGANAYLMAGFLALLVLVQSYTFVICHTRQISNGTFLGFAGWVWGVALSINTAQVSRLACLLLVPYLLWSPVGTFVTWRIQSLNR